MRSKGINARYGTIFRQHAGRCGAVREDHDGAQVQVARGMRHGLANGLGNRQAFALPDAAEAAAARGPSRPRPRCGTSSPPSPADTCPPRFRPRASTASVPSKMALATSLASARVGRGFSIIDSSICVAVITGRRKSSARRMICFWISGTFSGATSTPRSPRATITPSVISRMASRLSTACGFSSLAISGTALPRAAMACRARITSSAVRTKRNGDHVDALLNPKSRSASSFSVSDGMLTFVPGRLIP